MNRSVLIAGGIAAALGLYFLVGTMGAANDNKADTSPEFAKQAVSDLPEAVTMDLNAEPHAVILKLKGQTAADKIVTVKSGTVGTVVSTPAREGQYVKQGALLCGLDVEARQANVKQAEAQREAARIDFEAAQTLAKKGLTPANRQASAKASLDAAEAAVSSAKVELSKTQIRAPFAGIFETRLAEAGDFLSPGGACGVLVDLSPVLVTAQVTEDQSSFIKSGLSATATLASGEEYPATIRYVARTADARTRTFIVEAALKTGNDPVAAGITADLRIPLSETDAVKLTPAILTLADDGDLGVRIVDASNVVRFMPITVIDDADDGVWVTGLPKQVRVISEGQEFLSEGIEVVPVKAQSGPS